MMNPYLQQVNDWHKAFDYKQPTPKEPDLSDEETNNLREELIFEELGELNESLAERDPVATLDALADLQFVLSGAVLALGFSEVFDDAFAEVARSNMSKRWTNKEIDAVAATMAVRHFSATHIEFEDGRVATRMDKTHNPHSRDWIMRRADGKILKSPSYSPANLAQFVK